MDGTQNFEFNEEDEVDAERFNLLAQLDYYLLLQIILEYQKGKLSHTIQEISEFVANCFIHPNRLISSLNRLVRKRFLYSRPFQGETLYHLLFDKLHELGLPSDLDQLKKMDTKTIREIVYEKIDRVRKDIEWELKKKDTLKEIEKIKEEMNVMKKEMEESQYQMLRNMVGIFGIFVAIFSFIVIGANTALSIEPKETPYIVIILLLVFIFTSLLLLISVYVSRKG